MKHLIPFVNMLVLLEMILWNMASFNQTQTKEYLQWLE